MNWISLVGALENTHATPLDRDVCTAPTENEAMKIAEQLIAENIKKGWQKVVS